MNASHVTSSEVDTRRVARGFGKGLGRGDVVALYGDLGTGKTQFVKGLCSAFGVRELVASPTFVILHRYGGSDRQGKELLVYHFDLYRVQSRAEIFDLGYEEFFFGDGICVVEWADRLHELLPDARYDVHMSLGGREDERRIDITRVFTNGSTMRKSS